MVRMGAARGTCGVQHMSDRGWQRARTQPQRQPASGQPLRLAPALIVCSPTLALLPTLPPPQISAKALEAATQGTMDEGDEVQVISAWLGFEQ